jgi:Domain of unknown function (DUF4157)
MRSHASAPTNERPRAAGRDRDGADRSASRHSGALAALPAVVRDVAGSPGKPLEPEVGARFSAQLGHSFEHVRVHTDARAATSARLFGARAYTVGNHVAFADGAYRPGSPEGDRLIAHELVHVLQQGGRAPVAPESVVLAEALGPHDREAADVAERFFPAAKSQDEQRTSAVASQPVAVTLLPRTESIVVQRDLVGGLIGAGIGGLLGGGLGFAVGGPVGAIVGGVAGAVIGGIIGGSSPSPFPTYSEIVADADVQTKVNAAWASTLAATTAASRREEGFWIRLNKGTGKYEFTATQLGPVIGPTVTGSVQLGARPADTNPGTSTAIYSVGSFHTHTPTTYRAVGRPVGPSGADNTADTHDDVVGVVYDYVESPTGSGAIPAGHPLASSAQLWHSGPDRRQRM